MREALVDAIRRLPHAPGVYVFKDARGNALYVGKAADLRKRVVAYARPGGDGRFLMPFLEQDAAELEFVVTQTEQEALLLESTLCKKLKPRHNIRLKDDKAFLLLRLDPDEPWPWFRLVRRRKDDGALYFGPFGSARSVRRTLKLLHKVTPLRDCSDSVFANRSRPCLKHEMGRCPAPCVGLIGRQDYATNLARAIAILRGETAELEAQLRERMQQAAAALHFEAAQAAKDNLEALSRITERQRVVEAGVRDRDVIGAWLEGVQAHFVVLSYRDRGLESTRAFHFKTGLPLAELLSALVSQLYQGDRYVPAEVLLPAEAADQETLQAWLRERRLGRVELLVPERGDKRQAVAMADRNAELLGQAWKRGETRVEQDLDELRRLLGLAAAPRRIHCLDVSTIQGQETVASRVSLVDGQPCSAEYRRFKIRGAATGDDFAAMAQAVERSLRLCLDGERDDELPDLLLIDGGKGQLTAALSALAELGLGEELPVVALAKDKGGRGERVFRPGRSQALPLREGHAPWRLLTRARDEAHRFAIGYHRTLRERITSDLDEIEGLGPRRRRQLLKHFGSVSAIRQASLEDLARVPGLPQLVAEAVYRRYRDASVPR